MRTFHKATLLCVLALGLLLMIARIEASELKTSWTGALVAPSRTLAASQSETFRPRIVVRKANNG